MSNRSMRFNLINFNSFSEAIEVSPYVTIKECKDKADDESRRALKAAIEKVVEDNEGLAAKFAYKYAANSGMSVEDLKQVGLQAIADHAVDFDYELGFAFSTFISNHILNAIRETVYKESKTVTMPKYKYTMYSKIAKATKMLTNEYGREPSIEEIASKADMSVEEVCETLKEFKTTKSLETSVGDDCRLGDFQKSGLLNPEEEVLVQEAEKRLSGVLGCIMDERIRYVVSHSFEYFGPKVSQKEIAQRLGISGERVRQLLNKGLAIIKSSYNVDDFNCIRGR